MLPEMGAKFAESLLRVPQTAPLSQARRRIRPLGCFLSWYSLTVARAVTRTAIRLPMSGTLRTMAHRTLRLLRRPTNIQDLECTLASSLYEMERVERIVRPFVLMRGTHLRCRRLIRRQMALSSP